MGFYPGASRCKSCNAEIIWLKTKNGKDMPVDAGSVDLPLTGTPPTFDSAIMTSHFATCPNAGQHRKKG